MHALDIECEDDEQAASVVLSHPDRRAKELWQGARRVRTFDAAT